MITKAGIYIRESDTDNVVFDGNVIYTLLHQDLHNGMLYAGTKLIYKGVVLANAGTYSVLHEEDGKLMFGDISLLVDNICINITASDFSDVMSGNIPVGFKRHQEGTIYNIVSSYDNNPTITFERNDNGITFSTGVSTTDSSTVIYNNVPNVLSHNTENLTNTITSTGCPFVNTRYFNPIIHKNEPLEIEYHVDNIDNDWFNNNTISDTFTVEIANSLGTLLVKRTTYGGVFKIVIPAYSTIGEKTFSIRCIDSNGVSSPIEFLSVLVVEDTEDTIVDMSDYLDSDGNISFSYDGEEWVITLKSKDTITQEEAYNNKAALSAFFAMAKSLDATYVNMYNDNDTCYYIDYHKKLSNNTFGGCTYYKCTMNNSYTADGNYMKKSITAVTNASFEELCAARTANKYGAPIIIVSDVPTVGSNLKLNKDYNYSASTWYCVINSIGTKPSGGDYIVFPDNITIDLNGATIQALPSNDIVAGFVLKLHNNVNTHVINGKVYGNYKNFDFLGTSVNAGNPKPAEWLGVSDIEGSRYCSFENLDLGWSVGYDGCTGLSVNWFGYSALIDNKRIDLSTGEEVADTSMIVSDYKDCSSRDYIAFGRIGYAGYQYAGTQREIFFSFYDSNKSYIKSYKSRLYLPVRVPSNAKYVRLTGYGNLYEDGGDTSASAWSIPWKGSTENGSLNFAEVTYCYGCSKINCACHDTRTTAETGAAYCYLIDGCTYKNVAKEPNFVQGGWGAVTQYLSDMEDTWQWGRNYTMRNCKWLPSDGSNSFIVHYCTVYNFIGNHGITLENRGGIENGIIADNTLDLLAISKTLKSLHPHVMYEGNVIKTLNVSYEDYTATGEHVDKELVMRDTMIINKNSYSDLKLINSTNGQDVYV